MTFEYPKLAETVQRCRLSNGLEIVVVSKPYHAKSYAVFATRYGGMDLRFQLDGQWQDTPAGIAHYLEHKMFDLPGDRDVTAELAALGAGTNAFTSYDMTAYYFSCTEGFEDCLRLLLEFVSTPYFTEETVQKEQGIIGQEIDMNRDNPDTQIFEMLMENMYESHPIRVPILGTSETIREITPEILALAGGAGSNRGTGGMATKLEAAKYVTDRGIDMYVTIGNKPERIYDILEGKETGTHFFAQ